MERQTKNILLITGGVVLLSAISYAVYLVFKDKGNEDNSENGDSQSNDTQVNNNYYYGNNPQGNAGGSDSGSTNTGGNGTMIEPKYNGEKELSNGFGELKGRVLYPKRTVYGGLGYANVRSSAEVNTDRGWWDSSHNLLATFKEGTPIGKVLEEVTTEFNNYGQRWFKVKMYKSYWNYLWVYTDIGYVRADVVTFKPYAK